MLHSLMQSSSRNCHITGREIGAQKPHSWRVEEPGVEPSVPVGVDWAVLKQFCSFLSDTS